MDKQKIFSFIKKQKVAILATVDSDGVPNTRALLAPRAICGNDFYFSTNTSSSKVKEVLENPNACLYFYRKGLIRYEGVTLKGSAEILADEKTKQSIWRSSDKFIYKQGVNDPDYCVLKFTAESCKYYCDLHIEQVTI